MAEQSDRGATPQAARGVKPWTIKGIAPEERNAAIQAARRDKQDIGPWMAQAIRQKIQADRQSDRAPVPLGQPEVRPSDPASDQPLDLGALERMVGLARDLHAMTGRPPPRTIAAPISRLLRVGLRRLEGQTGAVRASD